MKYRTLRRGILLSLLGFSVVFGAQFIASHQASAAAPPLQIVASSDRADTCTKGSFFGLKPWFYYMGDELGQPKHGDTAADKCGVHCFNIFVQDVANECGQTRSDVPGILLAIIDDLLRVAGLVAIAFIIIGAFQYVASRGNSERTASAQSTIISALTGLAITLVAVAFVSFLGNRLF